MNLWLSCKSHLDSVKSLSTSFYRDHDITHWPANTGMLHGYNTVLKLNNDHPGSFICYKSIQSNNKACFHCTEMEGGGEWGGVGMQCVLLSETECFSWMDALFYKLLRLVFWQAVDNGGSKAITSLTLTNGCAVAKLKITHIHFNLFLD